MASLYYAGICLPGQSTTFFVVAQPEYTVVEYATQHTTMIVFAFKVEQKTLAKLY